jgi:PAS domain-containing protein
VTRLDARAAILSLAVAGAVTPACLGNIGEPPSGAGVGVEAAEVLPSPTLRRLIVRQYKNAVRDLLGEGAAAATTPPADSALNGFETIGAAQLSLGDAAVTAYETSARAAAAAAMGDTARIDALVGCSPAGPEDAACHRELIGRFGRLAWRRPLIEEELAKYTAVAQAAATEYGDFYAGVENVLATMLQSPFFLYQVELGAADAKDPSRHALSGYEIATRMSFFLLDTTPDEALLDDAEAGRLATPEGVREAAKKMLERPDARAALSGFYDEFLRLRELGTIAKDQTAFPQFSPALAQAMKEETLALISDVVWDRDADYRDILDADYTFMNAELAAFYGVTPPTEPGFVKVPLGDDQKRGGIFGQASFLSLFAHATSTSPTLRGRFVRERMLCQSIPAPPNNVVTELPSDAEAKTMREKLKAHQEIESCKGCHSLMDNIGFGLENYDGVGLFRTKENDVDIDTKSDIDGVPFDGAAELGAVLREDPDVPLCVARNIFRHATGHVETKGERASIDALGEAFEASGFRLKELLVEIVASEAFRNVGAPK